jgi:hypothetical protein
VASAIDDISDRTFSYGMEMMAERRGEFPDDLAMKLAGIAMVPAARQAFDDYLSAYWTGRQLPGFTDYAKSEVVIGDGLHAAIYCAARAAMGYSKPYVLGKSLAENTGGAFAVGGGKPVFWLNSRSRAGGQGSPDQGVSLNYLPGAPVQPDQITPGEYSTNADVRFAVRAALAQHAMVIPGSEVTDLNQSSSAPTCWDVTFGDRTETFGRVLDMRGIGTPVFDGSNGSTVITFAEFMTRMAGTFPLRGLQRVAVIGGGDSAKCAAESLLGIAPATHMSATALDYVGKVDWYAGDDVITTGGCMSWRDGRGRYIRLGQYLPGNVSQPSPRLQMFTQRVTPTPLAGGTVLIGERSYDLAVVCTGSVLPPLGGYGTGSFTPYRVNGAAIARSLSEFEVYRAGPAAALGFSSAEIDSGVASNPANSVAIFRNAPRTYALGSVLPSL